MWRLSGALLPGARIPGGPLSCGGLRVRGGAASAPPQAQPHLALASHLQKDRDHSAGLGGRPVQVPPPSVLANQLQREGSSGRQKRGR